MWELFDGPIFNVAHRVAGEWEVQVNQRRIKIRVVVDRDGNYYYRNNAFQSSRQGGGQLSKRGYDSMEQALEYAVREIKVRYGQ